MLPKIATDMAVMIMVFILFPSHTIKMGAIADLGRLFKITKYGSRISLNVVFHHRSIAIRRLIAATRKKLPKVSARVMEVCLTRSPVRRSSLQVRIIREGLLKIKALMIPFREHISHKITKDINIKN